MKCTNSSILHIAKDVAREVKRELVDPALEGGERPR